MDRLPTPSLESLGKGWDKIRGTPSPSEPEDVSLRSQDRGMMTPSAAGEAELIDVNSHELGNTLHHPQQVSWGMAGGSI